MYMILQLWDEKPKQTGKKKKKVARQLWTGPEFAKYQRAVENRKKNEETGCEVICGALTILGIKG